MSKTKQLLTHGKQHLVKAEESSGSRVILGSALGKVWEFLPKPWHPRSYFSYLEVIKTMRLRPLVDSVLNSTTGNKSSWTICHNTGDRTEVEEEHTGEMLSRESGEKAGQRRERGAAGEEGERMCSEPSKYLSVPWQLLRVMIMVTKRQVTNASGHRVCYLKYESYFMIIPAQFTDSICTPQDMLQIKQSV